MAVPSQTLSPPPISQFKEILVSLFLYAPFTSEKSSMNLTTHVHTHSKYNMN